MCLQIPSNQEINKGTNNIYKNYVVSYIAEKWKIGSSTAASQNWVLLAIFPNNPFTFFYLITVKNNKKQRYGVLYALHGPHGRSVTEICLFRNH